VRISISNSKIKNTILFILGIILIFFIIQILSWIKNDKIVFPDVIEIIKAFFNILGKASSYEKIGATLLRLIIALFFSLAFGVLIGLFEGIYPNVRTVLKPLMMVLRSLPMIVLVVIVMVLVSSSNWDNVPIIGTTILLIPLISEATAEGIKRMDKALIDVYKLNSNLRPFVVFKVHIPLILGYLKQAFINAIGMGIKVIVTTEYIVSARPSLGNAIYNSQYMIEYQDIYAYTIVMILLVLIVEGIPILLTKLYSYFKYVRQQIH
jgi:NitT/TauT family transport system permease protein